MAMLHQHMQIKDNLIWVQWLEVFMVA